MVHAERLGNRPAALTSLESLERFALLVIGELRLRAKPHAFGDSNLPAGIAAGENPPGWRGEPGCAGVAVAASVLASVRELAP